MRPALHDAFFYGGGFFLVGVLIASTTHAFTVATASIIFVFGITMLAACLLYLTRHAHLMPYATLMLIGAAYYFVYATLNAHPAPLFNKESAIEGIIVNVEHHLDSQELTLHNGIKIYADRYPEFSYGDRVKLTGTVSRTRSPFLAGTANARFKPITLVGTGNGYKVKQWLITLRERFENNLKKVLPREEAALANGLTMGTTEEFSKEFKAELLASGTSHITALSGSNIAIIVKVIAALLAYCMARKRIVWPTVAIITLFVMMTGAESSLVRAAVMGIIVLWGKRAERAPNMRNIITCAALLMVILNPKVLAFDLGFQLSFLAILGMEYLKPKFEKALGALARLPGANEALVAVSAQIAVLPLLIIKVDRATPWAIIPNILIGPMIPFTMAGAFITGIAGFITPTLAALPALLTSIILKYEMAIIHLFAISG